MEDRLKFRVWHEDKKKYNYIEIIDYLSCVAIKDEWTNGYKGIWEQCTGLKDKNGKLIYEGDILLQDVGVDLEMEISWNKDRARFEANGQGIVNLSNAEIIGNIHTEKDEANDDNK